jgi:hypothetical protein
MDVLTVLSNILVGATAGIIFALQNNRPDLIEGAIEDMTAPLKEFQKTVNNSLLYSDRELYLRLKSVGAKLRDSTKMTNELLRTGGEPTELYESNIKLLEETLFRVSKPIHGMLDLDALSLRDFEK